MHRCPVCTATGCKLLKCTGCHAARDWGDLSLPHLSIRGADAFEDPSFLANDFPSLTGTLLDPGKYIDPSLGDLDVRDVRESRRAHVVHASYAAFWETESLLGLLKDARSFVALADMRDDFASLAADPDKPARPQREHPHGDDCQCTPIFDPKKRESPGRLWNFVDYALRDATYLGPFANRPPQKLMTRYKGKAWKDKV